MKTKSIATAILLGFVGVSLAAIVVKETRARMATPVSAASSSAAPTVAAAPARVVAYYFHGNVRCATCNAIETQSRAAIEAYFADQLGAGRLEWRVVNFDEPSNAHFRDDFQLAFQSLVLVEERGGRIARWTNLADVWTWIHETPAEFEEYVVDATASFLSGDGA